MANHVHEALRDFFSIVPVEQRTADTLVTLLQKKWRRYRIGFRDRLEERRWYEKAVSQLRGFLLQQELTVQPFMLEAPIEAEITTGLVLRGRVDRVDKESSGSLHIIDYKTGKPPEQPDWTQLQLLALILSRRFPYPVNKLSLHYLSPGTIKTTELHGEELQRAAWDLLRTARSIAREKHYTATAGPHCFNCDFLQICPAKGKAYEQDIEGDFELWRDSLANLTAQAPASHSSNPPLVEPPIC